MNKHTKYIKASYTQFTSLYDITQIIKKSKVLVLAHGRYHTKYSFLNDSFIYLDINIACNPDIIGDFRNSTFMKRFPNNYFNLIILMYTPPPSPESPHNTNIWTECYRILQKGGILKSNYIIRVYNLKLKDKTVINNRIIKYFNKFFYQTHIDGIWVIMTKI